MVSLEYVSDRIRKTIAIIYEALIFALEVEKNYLY